MVSAFHHKTSTFINTLNKLFIDSNIYRAISVVWLRERWGRVRERAVRAGQGTEHGIGDPSTTSTIRGPPNGTRRPAVGDRNLLMCRGRCASRYILFKFHTLFLVFVLIFIRNRHHCVRCLWLMEAQKPRKDTQEVFKPCPTVTGHISGTISFKHCNILAKRHSNFYGIITSSM